MNLIKIEKGEKQNILYHQNINNFGEIKNSDAIIIFMKAFCDLFFIELFRYKLIKSWFYNFFLIYI